MSDRDGTVDGSGDLPRIERNQGNNKEDSGLSHTEPEDEDVGSMIQVITVSVKPKWN